MSVFETVNLIDNFEIDKQNKLELMNEAILDVFKEEEIPILSMLCWYSYFFLNKTFQSSANSFPNSKTPIINGDKLSMKDFDIKVDEILDKHFGVKELELPDTYWTNPELFSQEFKDKVFELDLKYQKKCKVNVMDGQSRERTRQLANIISKKIRNKVKLLEKRDDECFRQNSST